MAGHSDPLMRRRTIVIALAVAVAVIATGCLDGPTDDGPVDDGNDTVSMPPGVNGSGIQDVDALYAAHFDAVSDSAHVTNVTEVLRTGDGTRRGVTRQALGSDGNLSIREELTNGSRTRVRETWDQAGTFQAFRRLRRSPNSTTGQIQVVLRGENRSLATNYSQEFKRLLAPLLGDASQNVTRTGDAWRVTVRPDGGTSRFTLVARSDGLLTLQRQRSTVGEAENVYAIRTRYVQAVREPQWAERARQQRSENGTGFASPSS